MFNLQDPGMVESLSKNVTRQGMTSTTLNYLRVRMQWSWTLSCFSPMTALSHIFKHFLIFAAVCHPGADAGAHVPAQGVRAQPQGLPQNHALPEVAEDGRAAR